MSNLVRNSNDLFFFVSQLKCLEVYLFLGLLVIPLFFIYFRTVHCFLDTKSVISMEKKKRQQDSKV